MMRLAVVCACWASAVALLPGPYPFPIDYTMCNGGTGTYGFSVCPDANNPYTYCDNIDAFPECNLSHTCSVDNIPGAAGGASQLNRACGYLEDGVQTPYIAADYVAVSVMECWSSGGDYLTCSSGGVESAESTIDHVYCANSDPAITLCQSSLGCTANPSLVIFEGFACVPPTTAAPSAAPSAVPTENPMAVPSTAPTAAPTPPTQAPTTAPTPPTQAPTTAPKKSDDNGMSTGTVAGIAFGVVALLGVVIGVTYTATG
jgi:hypothetical protein